MSIQINVGDHVCPVPGWGTFPAPWLRQLKWARNRAKLVAKNMPSADRYFKRLPNGRSLSALLDDRTIWINYAPDIPGDGRIVEEFPNEIGLGQKAFQAGRWMVLGTLLHELAHVNGAEGGESRSAEQTLVHCGLGRAEEITEGDDPRTPFAPWVRG